MDKTSQQSQISQQPVEQGNTIRTLPSQKSKKKFIIIGIVIIALLIVAPLLIWFHKTYRKTPNKISQSITKETSCMRSKTYTLKSETKAKIDESNKMISEARLIANKTNSDTGSENQNITDALQQSINDTNNAVRLEPKNPLTWEQQGKVYEALIGVTNDADTFAVSSYQQALAIDPRDCPALMGLGNVYTANNNYTSAIKSYKTVTQFYPNYFDAHASLATLYQLTNQQTEEKKELSIMQKLSGNSKNSQLDPLKF